MMMMGNNLDQMEVADPVEKAVSNTLDAGLRTRDIMSEGMTQGWVRGYG